MPIGVALLFGWVVALLVAILELVFLALLPRFGGNRATLASWRLAFLGLCIALIPQAMLGLVVVGAFTAPELAGLNQLNLLSAPGEMLFVVGVALAAVQSARRTVSVRARWAVAGCAVVLGALAQWLQVEQYLMAFAIVVLVLGATQVVLIEARGERTRGLRALAVSMAIFATIWTAYHALDLGPIFPPDGSVVALVIQLRPFAYIVASLVLAAGVAILTIQDAILEAARSREESLRVVGASEARLRQVIGAAGEAIVTFADGGRIESANEAAARLFGLATGDLVGRRLPDLVALDHVDWAEVLESPPDRIGHGVVRGGRGRRAGGAEFPLELTLGSLADGGSGPGGGVAILRDLTQRIAAEAERERFERRLAESEKMLAIGRVVSGVAHELNNPLAVVLGQSERLADGAEPAEVQAGMQLINEQARRARHIVRDLLAFVRQREDLREPVDLGDLLERVVSTHAVEARSHDVTLDLLRGEGAAVALADRLAVEQVVVNLIDNAIDASAPGGTVRVRVEARTGSIRLTVEDEGPGVPDELVSRIFEPFFTTKPTGQGTGLGLAVSVGLLERMGGSLQLENRPSDGVGARFVVQLPAATADGHAAGGTAAASERAWPDGPSGQVLVIDDEPSVRVTIERIFDRWGWRVEALADAADALERIRGDHRPAPDLVLCDIRMPGMTGEEFFEALDPADSRQAATRERIVFVTGDVVAPATAEFLARADRPVIEKPFTLAELARVAERFAPSA